MSTLLTQFTLLFYITLVQVSRTFTFYIKFESCYTVKNSVKKFSNPPSKNPIPIPPYPILTKGTTHLEDYYKDKMHQLDVSFQILRRRC